MTTTKQKNALPKTQILFTLTMPRVNTWNNRYSGEGRLYAKTRRIKDHPNIKEGQYEYDFGDGWTACVTVEFVDRVVAEKARKKSVGFSTYGWMIESIDRFGVIKPSKEWEDQS